MRSNLDPVFGLLLKSIRLDRNISLKELSLEIDYSIGNISKWENSRAGSIRLPPRVETVKHISTALGCDKVDEVKLMRAYAEDLLRDRGIDPTQTFE